MYRVGQTNLDLVKVELMWVQDLRSSPNSSWRILTNNLNISYYRTKVPQNEVIIHIDFLEKQILWPTLIFYKNLSVGWK